MSSFRALSFWSLRVMDVCPVVGANVSAKNYLFDWNCPGFLGVRWGRAGKAHFEAWSLTFETPYLYAVWGSWKFWWSNKYSSSVITGSEKIKHIEKQRSGIVVVGKEGPRLQKWKLAVQKRGMLKILCGDVGMVSKGSGRQWKTRLSRIPLSNWIFKNKHAAYVFATPHIDTWYLHSVSHHQFILVLSSFTSLYRSKL